MKLIWKWCPMNLVHSSWIKLEMSFASVLSDATWLLNCQHVCMSGNDFSYH